jgi:hypothetical protein
VQELDEQVEQLYRLARGRAGEVWTPSRLAVAILGHQAIAVVPGLPQLGMLLGRQIRVREGLLPAIEEWAIGHELGHLIRGSTSSSQAEEDACNYIGAAIQMRRAPFAKRFREVGNDYVRLARDFGTTETSAVMRIGEVTGRPVAVVLRHRIYARGELATLPERSVRALAFNPWPGVQKVELTDSRERLAVDATMLMEK